MSQLIGYNEPFPVRDAIVKETRKPADVLVRYEEQSLQQRLNATPFRLQGADILTDITSSQLGTLGGDEVAGLYRVSVYREVLAADGVSSGLEGVIGWTHNGKALTRDLSAFSGAPQTISDNAGDNVIIEVDPGTPISYVLTYASAGAGAVFYAVLCAELLQPIS